MEKITRSKNKVFSFLPKSATVSFQNHPFSPGRDKRSAHEKPTNSKFKSSNGGKGFSGPIISMIPAEARIQSKSGRTYDAQEPTSPKISCMGQIKHKKKCKIIAVSKPQPTRQEKKTNRSSSSIRNIFSGVIPAGKKSSVASANKTSLVPDDTAPSLGQMKRFSSGRDALSGFDWRYYSEREDSDEEEEDEVIVPHSAPMMIGGGKVGGVALEPRKEVNLWKRRTMNPPKPLQLNAVARK